MSKSLKTRMIVACALTITVSLGISEILLRKQAASFFEKHESRIEQRQDHGTVLAELHQDKLSLSRQLAGTRLLIASAAVGTLSITLAYVWRRRVSRPIALVSDRIHKMRLGTWHDPIPVQQNDEIGALMREFNDLGPTLAFTAHQYAAASKLAAMALIGQRVVRRTTAARQRLLAVSESLSRRPGDEHFQHAAVEQIRVVAAELEDVAADFDSEFQAELARVGTGAADAQRA